MIFAPAQFITPEAVNAFGIAVVGALGAYAIARHNAKTQDRRDDRQGDRQDEQEFRGQLSDDNKALRQEVWDLKKALRTTEDTIDRLRAEALILQEGRNVLVKDAAKTMHAAEDSTESLGDRAGPIDRSARVDLGPRPK